MSAAINTQNIVVIGAGAMGRNHCRALRTLRGFHLVAIVDDDPQRAHALADEMGVASATSLADVKEPFTAAIVATPTATHEQLLSECLDRGAHVLVEKPIAIELSAAARMIAAAKAADRILMVGHVERFNGAILAVKQYIDDPIHFNCQRVGPFDSRIIDGIILDLMIHDLDLVGHLTGLPGVPNGAVSLTMHGRTEDHATSSVLYGDRTSASFTASRVGQSKVRTMEITQPRNSISIDLIRQDITIHTVESLDFGPDHTLRQRGLVEIPFVERSGQPLTVELDHFWHCIVEGVDCLSDGEDGLRALELVRRVELSSSRVNR